MKLLHLVEGTVVGW